MTKRELNSQQLQLEIIDPFLKSMGSLALSKYYNRNISVEILCPQCGGSHKVVRILESIRRENFTCLCKLCRDAKQRFSGERIEADILSKGIVLLNKDEVVDALSPLLLQCIVCQEPFTFSHYNSFKYRTPSGICPKCRAKEKSTSVKEIQEGIFREEGVLLNLEEIKTIHSPLVLQCMNCFKPFSYHSYANFKSRTPDMLCPQCRYKALSGKNNSNYNHAKTEEERQAEGNRSFVQPEYHTWLTRVKHQRGNLLTSQTSMKKKSIHHIYNFAHYPHLREFIWNGVCIDSDVHLKQFHKQYGMGHNTYYQFKEFYQQQTGQEFFLYEDNHTVVDVIAPTTIPLSKTNLLLNRKKEFQVKGKNYIPVFEYEIQNIPKIINSIINNKMNIPYDEQKRYFARKLSVEKITSKQTTFFIAENHRQKPVGAPYSYALTDGTDLISIMTFGLDRFGPKSQEGSCFELLRFASKLNHIVVGGTSRLFKAFIRDQQPDYIKTYADLRFSSLDIKQTVYDKLGFEYKNQSAPNYWYIKDGVLSSRVAFQKHKLKEKLQFFDPALTEKQNMTRNDYQIYYDCGNHVFGYSV